MTITPSELNSLQLQYERDKPDYEHLSEHVMALCQGYKKLHPRGLRAVFSRQPIVKDWGSTLGKIQSRRASGESTYGVSDVKDLIGLTILCAYESDKEALELWLKKAFRVDVSEAKIDDSGHRALHYIVRPHAGVCVSNPQWQNKRCEIQIKTLLEEAFDAKAHDLTYKPGHLPVTPEIKQQFKHFSAVLHAVDMQSEFLKGLILATERQTLLRRAACVGLYLDYPEDLEYGRKNGLDPKMDNPPPDRLRLDLETIQRLHAEHPNIRLCRLTASYALKFQDELFAQQALIMCGPLAASAPKDGVLQMGVATVEWALNDFDAAMNHLLQGIDHAGKRASAKDTANARSTFVYLCADRVVNRKSTVLLAEWDERARRYVDELKSSKDPSIIDTLGFHAIVFGATRDEIEAGRTRVQRAHRAASPALRPFFHYHEHIAIGRLGELLRAELRADEGRLPDPGSPKAVKGAKARSPKAAKSTRPGRRAKPTGRK